MAERDRPVYCTQCGSIVQPGNNFCGACGAPLAGDGAVEFATAAVGAGAGEEV